MQQENRVKKMGSTVKSAGSYIERMKLNEERKKTSPMVIRKMSVDAAVVCSQCPFEG